VNGETITSDLVLSGADYHHTETLLDKEFRAYSEKMGQSSSSSLLFYVGFDKKLKTYHIMLCFLMWILSACKDIYDAPQWPKEPLFYANSPLTDKTAARKEWNQVFSCSAGTWN
jgi:phytoene desaturase